MNKSILMPFYVTVSKPLILDLIYGNKPYSYSIITSQNL